LSRQFQSHLFIALFALAPAFGAPPAPPSDARWGTITGSIANQGDLVTLASAAIATHEAAADPHTGYQKESEKGSANGYASLGAAARVPTAELGSGTANATTFLRGDQTWGAPTASVAISVAEIDFGVDAKFSAVATITDAAISATSKIIITQAGIAATGRQADENEMDAITCNAMPATGTFTLRCHTAGSPTHGKFNVWYTAS
jgi:hypothetical protein